MHFLLGLLGFAAICYLVGIIFFNKENDPAVKFRKGLITTLLAIVVIGIATYLVVRHNKEKARSEQNEQLNKRLDPFENETSKSEPSAKLSFDRISQVNRDGVEGLEIKIGGEFENLTSETMNIAIWFYFGEKGKYDSGYAMLKDYNNKYSTTDGQVTTQSGYTIKPSNGTLSADSIPVFFIPLDELHLAKNYAEINEGRYSNLDKITENNRIRMIAGVFQDEKSLYQTESRVYTVLD